MLPSPFPRLPDRFQSARKESRLRFEDHSAVKPARSKPRWASGFRMKVSHTKPVRTFSAMSMVIPVSMPITSVSYQFVSGLNAFTNPYRLQALDPYRFFIFLRTNWNDTDVIGID